jgi:hypothetical protein
MYNRNRNFDRNFNRMRTFTMIWFFVIAVLVISTFVGVGYIFYSAATDPEAIGNFIGSVVNGFSNTIN